VAALLDVRAVSKSFGGLKALQSVDLQVEPGESHAIIGPNGAGKSTLLNVFVGKLVPDSGVVAFDGHSLLGRAPYQINQAGVARVFQTPEIFSEQTLLHNVMIPAFAKRDGKFRLNVLADAGDAPEIREQAEHALAEVGLAGRSSQHAGSLARGDKRRLELAMCLVQRPRLLLLDEPTAGMSRHDTNSTIALLKSIKSGGMTKVIIEHDMSVVFSLADRITVLQQGAVIASGRPEEVRSNSRVQEAYLGGAHVQ
jgi:branched-chain amino acid transport system ATP-binding protein